MSKRNYWCYRIDTSKIKYFESELTEGRLRQGWGWDDKQDLRNFKMDEGAGRNFAMFNRVKKRRHFVSSSITKLGRSCFS